MTWPQGNGDPYGQQPGYQPSNQSYSVEPYSAQPGYNAYQQPPTAYPQVPYQQPVAAPYVSRPTNGMAIGALVCGIAGLVVVPLAASIVGVVLGHIAKKQINDRNEEGGGMAVAGLVTGYIGIGIWGFCTIGYVVLWVIYGIILVGASSSSTGYTFVTALSALLGS